MTKLEPTIDGSRRRFLGQLTKASAFAFLTWTTRMSFLEYADDPDLIIVAAQSPEACPLVEYLINHVGYKPHFQKDPLLTDNGVLPLLTAPGFGIVLDEDKIDQREVL